MILAPLRRLLPLLALGLVALPGIGCGAQQSGAARSQPESAQDRVFGQRVRAYLIAHPEVVGDALAALQTRQAAQAEAVDANAIAAHRAELERDPRDAVAGNPAGRVTVVEFFDYRCPYCRSSALAIQAWLAVHKDVRLVLKEFPILSDASEHAARAAIAARPSGKYLALHAAFLAEKTLDDDAIARTLRAQGLDPAKVRATGAGAAATQQIKDVHALALTLGIDGTPTFVVGGKKIPGWIVDDLDAAVKAQGAPAPTG